MRRYNVAVAALAINAHRRWVDNALSQFAVDGVQRSARGRSRRLPTQSVLHLAIAHRLWTVLGIPVGHALELARPARAGDTVEREGIRLSIDIESIARELELRLASAVENAVTPRRGRPPSRR